MSFSRKNLLFFAIEVVNNTPRICASFDSSLENDKM